MARPKKFPVKMMVRVSEEVAARMVATLKPAETMAELARVAIERELALREAA